MLGVADELVEDPPEVPVPVEVPVMVVPVPVEVPVMVVPVPVEVPVMVVPVPVEVPVMVVFVPVVLVPVVVPVPLVVPVTSWVSGSTPEGIGHWVGVGLGVLVGTDGLLPGVVAVCGGDHA